MEKGKICEIMLVTPDHKSGGPQGHPEGDWYYRIPDPSKTPDHELFIKFLQRMIRKEVKIIHHINQAGKDPKNAALLLEAASRKEYFEMVLKQEVEKNGSNL